MIIAIILSKMNTSEKYLLTGSTGQLWPMVLKSLLEQWVHPDCIHLLIRSHTKATKVFETHQFPQMPTIVGDITENLETLAAKIPQDIQYFVNMAGSVKFWEAARTEVESVNLHGAVTVAKLALARWLLTHVSTSYILGQVDAELWESFIDENTPRKPKNPYEEAKWNAEIAIGKIFEGRQEKVQIVRPSILTDSIGRPDLWWELHAAMWYYAPFIHLRKTLTQKWITGWVSLGWFEFAGNYDNPINIIDNRVAGDIIGRAIMWHRSRVINVVNSTPPTYGELTRYVLDELQFTGYKINWELILNNQNQKTIGDIEQWKALQKVLLSAYNRNSKPNYYPYATHNSRFAGGLAWDSESLARSATKILLS